MGNNDDHNYKVKRESLLEIVESLDEAGLRELLVRYIKESYQITEMLFFVDQIAKEKLPVLRLGKKMVTYYTKTGEVSHEE